MSIYRAKNRNLPCWCTNFINLSHTARIYVVPFAWALQIARTRLESLLCGYGFEPQHCWKKLSIASVPNCNCNTLPFGQKIRSKKYRIDFAPGTLAEKAFERWQKRLNPFESNVSMVHRFSGLYDYYNPSFEVCGTSLASPTFSIKLLLSIVLTLLQIVVCLTKTTPHAANLFIHKMRRQFFVMTTNINKNLKNWLFISILFSHALALSSLI